MKLYNFKATSLNTKLDGSIMLEATKLEQVINTYPANGVLFHGYYDMEKRESFTDYKGILRPVFDTIHIDLDSEEDEGLAAWEDTKKLCKWLGEKQINFHVYFSGNKGFHVAVHTSAFGITEGEKDVIESQVKSVLYSLKTDYPTVDLVVWNANRKFRSYRSQHNKSGLYKIRLTGIGIKASELSLSAIRNMALTQPVHKYAHPTPVEGAPLQSLTIATTPQTTGSQGNRNFSNVKELPQGQTVEDDSLKFRNHKGKLCIKEMQDSWLPQFNRHDIGLRLIYDYRLQGLTAAETTKKLSEWATKVFDGDRQRVTDTERMVTDAYSKPQDYQFACYDSIKQAYCSAKCKLYNQLDRKKRAQPVDTTDKQRRENLVRDNPLLELSEGQIADEILGTMPQLCKASGQYFQWEKTHWKRIDGPMFEDLVKKSAMAAYSNEAPIQKVKALSEHILTKIPMAPETNNFFSSSPNKFNFTDCTAIVVADSKGNLKLETREHKPNDYLSYCAPFPLNGEHGFKSGGEFAKYLETRRGDVGDDGIRIIKQMLGAALIPYAPRIFFIEGITNAGKSTLALLIKRLLGSDNVAEVQPVVHGNGGDRFNWEPSIGKIANVVLELDDRKPLDTTVLKMVRDKTQISVDRKGKGHVKATLPFFHVYCCNEMPRSLEGNSGALNNRVTMLYFKPGYLNGSGGIVEYAENIWNEDAGGVLQAAREGLLDLMESGFRYYESEDSKLSVKKWQKRSDTIALFIEDLQNNEWEIVGLEGKEWEKGIAFYESFKNWCEAAGRRVIGKHSFYDQLRTKHGVPCQERGMGGVKFKVSGLVKSDCDANAMAKSSMISETLAF